MAFLQFTRSASCLILTAVASVGAAFAAPPVKIPLDRFTYIQVDDSRGKWGDFAPPDWLKYYGLSAHDVNGDGYLDVIAGRYFYLNPGGDMTGRWQRTDLGRNVDAMLFVDVDGDEYADCIAEALPDVYWLEAQDRHGKTWKAIKVASVPQAQHVNGQGIAAAQIVPGGSPEIVLSTGKGVYYIEIPSHPEAELWPVSVAAPEASEQGLAVGDVDGDGLIDIAAACGDRVEPRSVAWWKNPGRPSNSWKRNDIGQTANYSADRLVIADLNGDGRADILVTEESWQTQDRVAQLFCFEQGRPGGASAWERRSILTAGSLNSLNVADLDHDGDLDLVTCEHKGKDKRLFVLENDGHGRFTQQVIDHGKESHLGTLLFDLDGDGDLDILSVAWDDYRYLHLWRNDALNATFTQGPRAGKTRWCDIRSLTVEGKGWSETKAFFDRLPARAEGVVRPPIWDLSHDSAGLCVRFTTDATSLQARWTVTSKQLAMPHMPATGVSGLDLYARTERGPWRWVAVGQPQGASTSTVTLVSGLPEGKREFLLYLPLYNGVSVVEIGIPGDRTIEQGSPRPASHRQPIVFYGTSITQGGCASRPGMVHTAILGRRLDRSVINLGFSGNGLMEPEMAALLSELDPAIYVLDCLPNMTAELVRQRVEPFVRTLRKARSTTPIVLAEDRTYSNAPLVPEAFDQNRAHRAALKSAYERLIASGIKDLHYLPGETQLGDDGEGTVDGSHPTDLGFFRMAESFAKVIEPVLRESVGRARY